MDAINRELIFRRVAEGELSVDAAMALLAPSKVAESSEPAVRSRQPVEPDGPFPLSVAQRAVWSYHELHPGTTAYQIPVALRLREDLELADLEAALAHLDARHPMLRARLLRRGVELAQRVATPGGFRLEREALGPLSEAGVVERLRAEARRPLDLEQGPSWRALVLEPEGAAPVLLLVFHHLFFDGLCIPLVLGELARLHAAARAGQSLDAALPAPASTSFDAFVEWQRERLDGEGGEELRRFWAERFPDAPPTVDLRAAETSLDARRRGLEGAHLRLDLPAEVVAGVEALAAELGTTPFVLTLAVWLVLLRGYGRSDELCVGVPAMSRPSSAFEALVGYFSNVVVIRQRLDAGRPFSELVEAVHDAALDAVAHGDYPLAELIRENDLRGKADFFQAAFYFQNWFEIERAAAATTPLWTEYLGDVAQEGEFELVLEIHRFSERWRLFFKYDPAVHDAGSIARMAGRYRNLLDQVLADARRPVGQLQLPTPSERARVLGAWSRPESAPAPVPAWTVPERFAELARDPGQGARVALRCAGEVLSYAELHARASAVAVGLRGRGVGRGSVVGVMIERSSELVVALLGTLLAGAAYLPLDPIYPEARLRTMLEDSGAALLLVDAQGMASALTQPGSRWTTIELSACAVPGVRAALPAPAGEDLAYLIYTSGSTGRPKGVPIRHESLANLLAQVATRPGFGPDDRMLAATTVCFDIAMLELFLPLTQGGELVLMTSAEARDGQALVAQLESGAVSVAQATPATWRMALAAGWRERAPVKILCGGEALPADLAQALLSRCDALWNMYGPTEATIWASCDRVRATGPVTIGRPLGHYRLYILDDDLAPVAPGLPGDLYIGGVALSPGYHGRPELDAKAFVANPHDPEDAPRLYRTGDVARFLSDGRVEWLRRADDQVKILGYRVELGEIDAALRALPGIADAAAVIREDSPGVPRIVAYVVRSGSGDEASWRAALGERLPSYMIPRQFVAIEALPLSHNLKVDRKRLAREPLDSLAPETAPTLLASAPVPAPATSSLVEALGQLCAELMGIPGQRLDPERSLFSYGFNSITATQLRVEIARRWGRELELVALAEGPSVASVAAMIGAGKHAAAPAVQDATAVGSAGPADAPFALTPIQEAYLAGRLLAEEGREVGCHIYVELDADGFTPAALGAGWQALIDGHQALRTVILPSGREQAVLPGPLRYTPEHLALDGLDQGARETRVEALRARMEARLYDPQRWPLFEVAIVTEGPRTRVHLSIDNLFVDGASLVNLLAQWSRLARGESVASLGLPSLSFRDYCVALERGRSSGALAERRARDLDYWVERLRQQPEGPRLPYLPQLRRREPLGRRRYRGELEPARFAALEALARDRGVTPTAVLLAAFQLVLRAWSEDPNFSLILTLFQRAPLHPEVDAVVGSFTSTSIFHVDAPAVGSSLAEQARAVHRQLWTDLSHDAASGVDATREYHRRHRSAPSSIPVVFTSLVGHVGHERDPALAGWIRAVAGEHARTQTPDVALDHQVFDVDGRLHYFWDVDEDRFVADVPALLFRDYEAVLDALLAEPEAFTEQPTQALLPRTLDALFLRQAARTPAAVAVIAADRRLSYAQLRGRVVELAHRLVALGVARGDRVAVVARKGWEQVVAALAVNVAGAAYVPIDPTMPAARLGHIVEFTEARVALTQSSLDASLSWPAGLVRVCVDAMGDGRAFVERALPQLERQPTDLAYVIFTSGSTGTPKGVMLDHRGPVNTILDVNARFEIGPADRTLAVSSLGFDLSVYDLFGLLAVGGAVVVPEPEDLRDPLRLAELVEAHAVTIWNTVPAYADLLEEAARGSAQLRSLRVVMMSGDWIPVGLPDRLRAQCPAAAITSLGGATEASIWSILYPIGAVDPSWKSIPYGAAMVAQPWCLIDEDGQVVDAVGVPAQLHIGGVGVALGYWRNPDKTGAAFITHPETGERIYATGDRGQLRADGNYEFLGRIDRQVKLNGYRIELGEIEATLQRCEGVARALVLVLGEGQARHLGAFVEAEAGAGAGPSEAELVALAKQWLPTYMQPKTYACVRRLQLTANGKVDRRVSPEQLEAERVPFGGATSSPAPSTLAPAPATPSASPESVFAELAAVAAEFLGAAVEGPQVDLFELGATSLTIMRLVQRVRERFGVRVPAGRLFESPRLETLVQAVVAAQPKPAAAKAERSPEAEAETNAEPEAEPSLLLTHARREAFKARQLHLRTLRAEQRVELSPARLDAPALAARNQTRRSVRRFGAGPVSQGALSSLLEAARVSVAEDGSGSTKAAYPSAGHLYAVQIYVEVKAGRVEGLAGGVYYYHPVEHALARLSGAALPSTAHVAHNREIHRSGAFVLHLIAAMDAVEPLYGEASETLVTLDAGYLGQHFYAAAGPLGLGLCAIGTLDFEALRAHFELDATHRHVHALVGGVDPQGASASPDSRGEARVTAKVEVIPEAQASSTRAPAQAEPIAIVGLAGRYPGVEGLDGPEGLWGLIESGGHRVGAPPVARGWSEADSRGVRAGFLDDIARFEPLFFRISPREAATMDPQERLFLEVAWQALEDAGYTPESLRARLGGEAPVGVYAGVMSHQYALCGDAVPAFHHAIANRVSWCFDLDGPSLAVDTACSASLSAIHLAVQAIRAGECRWALAGGVNLSLHPSKFRYMQRMRLSSPSGRCSTFGAGADGIVTGEGAGVIVLKPLSAALADGDHVHALIRGTALNHTGKTRAFTVPDSTAQGALIRQAIEDAGVDPSSISHVETHGTGTALGDPIEIRGLNKAWEEVEAPPTGVVLGSLKPNLGHLESAAGVASLTRVLLQMRHRTLAPTPSAAEPNPELELEGSPFVLPTQARAWAPRDAAGRELPLRAGLSSFGAGGANAHLVLEAFEARGDAEDSDADTLEGPWILPLSAGTPEQRQRLAERTREHLAQGCWDARALRDLCFTLQVGRRHHGHRGVVIGSLVVEFDAGLELLAQGEDGPQAWVSALGSGHERADAEAAPSTGADAETHARAWLAGAALDWAALPVNQGARRRPAPVYPFAGARHWVEAPATTEAPAPALVVRDSEPSALAASVEREVEAEAEAGAESVCFEPAFEAADARPEGPAPSRVLLVDPRVARADRWRLQLPVIHVRPVMGGAWEEDEDGRFRVDPTRPGALERLLDELGEPDTIVWVHDEQNPGREQGLRALLRTLGARRPRPARLMILAPAASLGEAEGLDGLVATAAAEWPQVHVKLVALEASAPAEIVDPALLDELRDPTRVVGFDDRGYRHARSWRQAAPSEAPSVRELVARWPADAGVVIAGGMGGFGRTLALHLAQAGVARLVLLGRSALDEDGRRHLDALEAAGARALYLPVDIADASALLGLRGILERACPQVRGVIHCATTHYDAPLGAADLDRWAQLEATKLAGAEHLDALTAGAELDFFVVCSSLISLVGNRGQGAYARANGQLNDFAHARARAVARGERRGASASLCLPLLAGGGMRPSAQTLAAMAKAGLSPLPDDAALAWFEARASAPGVHALAFGERARVEALLDLRPALAPGESVARPAVVRAPRPVAPAPEQRERDLLGPLLAWLRERLGSELAHDPEHIDPRAPFEDYGLDSVMIYALNGAIEDRLGVVVSKTLFFEHACLEAVCGALLEAHGAAIERAFPPPVQVMSEAEASPQVSAAEATREPIAIIGLSGRYPEAPDLDALWANLVAGRDCVGEVPSNRWDIDAFFDPDRRSEGSTYTRWGAFLDGVEEFEHRLFKIAPREARQMDPQERLLLQTAWAALEDAGYCRASFLDTDPHARTAMAPNRVGVYTGVTWGGHQLYAAEAWAHGQRLTLDSSFWSIANRVSWMFNFRGPSMPIDTACSASLVGIAMACEALVRGEIDMALAGGVNLYLHPSKYLTIAAQGFASSDGKCRAFGRGGDGYVPGEGVGVVILKPLSKAERDGDAIHGLIRGWAVNHDGFTNGYSVPNPRAQSEVVSMAMERGGVDPQTITYVEAHGTGTALGDPIEVAGLTAAFGRADAPWCGLGAIKSNIGHLESAAGIVGLTKVLLQMRHRTLVPTLHVEALNPNLDMHRSPFRIQRELAPWEPPAGIPRRAGLSSFGAGGVNAHLVLEEYREPAKRRAEVSVPSEPERHCLVLSARTAPQLRKVAEALRARLAEAIVAPDEHPRLDLANLAFTLQLGREPLNVRLAWLASDLREAMAGLDAYLGGPLDVDDSTHGPGPWMGRSSKATGTDARSRDQAQAWLRARELSTCARAWVRGRALDWHELHPEDARRRVHLPTYPFVGERLWMPDRFTWTKPAAGREGAEDELPEMAMVTPRWQPWTSILEASTEESAAAESGATVVLTSGSSQTCDELLGLLDAPSAEAPRIVVETGGPAVYRAQGIARLGPHHLRAPLDDAGDADALLAALSESGAPPIVRVIDLCDVQPGPRAPTTVPHGRLRLLQRWIAGTRRRALRLIHVHRDVDPRDARDFDGPSALLAGLLPVLDAEYGRLAALDLEFGDASTLRHAPADAVRRLLASGRGRARLRNGMLERLELEPHPVMPIPDSALRMNPNGVYLLSGGTGGVALTLAGALVDRGARRLALLERGHSRSAEVIEARAKAIAELEARGAQVLRHQGSLLDSGGLDDLLARLSQVGPVLGVIHAAGWNDPSEPAFIHKTRAQMEKVFEAKIPGLHGLASALSRHGHRPDWVVLCSSISAAVPSLGVGMSDYAAANAWMDRYATSRDGVGSGTRWLSLRWPNWSEVGMGETPREPLRRLGLAPLRNVDGVALFECALVGDFGPVVTPVAIDEEAREGFTLKRWLEGSLGEPARSKADAKPGAKPQPRASEAATPTATLELGPVHAWLQAQLSETLELPEEELEVDLSFEEFGLDSILMVRLLGQLDRELGVALDPSALIELGTIERLSEHLLAAHPEALGRVCGAPVQAEAAAPLLSSEPAQSSQPVQPAQPVAPPVQARVTVPRTISRAADEPIAIIGMAGHFPGAPSVEQFWANLRDGVDAIAEVPESRWSAARYFSPKHAPGKTISRWGGFLPNIEDFDPAYFELDEAQARGFDPLIRQTLEVGAEAFAHAGYSRAQLRGSRTGVWLGARVSDFIRRVDPSKHGIVGVGQNFIAAHLAHFYDLRGPNLIVDSACSSSLVTVHQACQALRAGEVELALAGGVDLLLDEQPYLSLSESRALSPTGRCRTFDRHADGFVPGEGCGMVLLARLSDALERGDRVLAIIEGSAVNNDGRTMGVTTPNPEAQVEVVREALRRAGAEARSVSLIEAHGTGTVIGDPIELKALTRVFRESTQARGVCGIGSVKSNVGHLASAAGIAGLIKVAACLQARYQAPTLHCLEPNPRFDFAASPFAVLTQGRPWQPVEGVRRGGVSAFGLGGTNAHVVLAEAPEHRPTRAALPAPTFHRRRLWPDAPARPETAPRPARRRLMQLEFSR